ncbi:sulfate ABC transporter permease subunit CysW [Mycobacterium sp.]|uniref:sulfate ABC transporter permease subunit CysW n=1 Tax=Mycobacterium sp. TaxID=1785 RepID=UPI001227A398|nr:sulfate ABC transporter permease subunit CysW [Mycobacterium sp.]TAM64246.1 MAG: sulfate ABC transporter permease subunit CysW [Mycobacterium sp.]
MTSSTGVRYSLRFIALGYVFVLLVVPVTLILWRTFRPGFGEFYAWVSTPAAISALNLTLLVVAIVVPLNVVFGIPTALVLARNRFRGKGVLQAIIDLPFAVSPVIVGVALVVLWGSGGALGFVEKDLGFKIIFGLPGIVLASIFVTLPFVVREVEPVLHELGTDQEEAAATLGSGWWQTFWRITLPSIRWGLTYGIVLTIARTLGEYGAVLVVSSNLPGKSQTLTLLVSDRYNRGVEYGAYALSTLLMGVAVLVLIFQVVLDARRARAARQTGRGG